MYSRTRRGEAPLNGTVGDAYSSTEQKILWKPCLPLWCQFQHRLHALRDENIPDYVVQEIKCLLPLLTRLLQKRPQGYLTFDMRLKHCVNSPPPSFTHPSVACHHHCQGHNKLIRPLSYIVPPGGGPREGRAGEGHGGGSERW